MSLAQAFGTQQQPQNATMADFPSKPGPFQKKEASTATSAKWTQDADPVPEPLQPRREAPTKTLGQAAVGFEGDQPPIKKFEGVSQSKRAVHGYKGEDPTDYVVSEEDKQDDVPKINVVPDQEKTNAGVEPPSNADYPNLSPEQIKQRRQQDVTSLSTAFDMTASDMAKKNPAKFKFTPRKDGFSLVNKDAFNNPSKPNTPEQDAAAYEKFKNKKESVKRESKGSEKLGSAAEEYAELKKKYKGAELKQKEEALAKRLAAKKKK
jgi:hypothetical protein